MADEELLLAAQEDSELYGIFYRRHVDSVLAFFSRRLHNRELVADLCHETFASAMIALPNYDPQRGAPLTWLFMLANRRLIDALRRRTVQDNARQKLGIEPMLLNDQALERIEEQIDAGRGGETLAVFEQLSRDHREVIHGHVLNDESYPELAARLQCSQSVVRQRVRRGLSQLRKRLDGP